MNLNIKSNNAITLIALVITIIVLLILAGITTNVLFGNDGIFTRSEEAREKTAYAVAREKLDLALSSLRVAKMEQYTLASINEINEHQRDIFVIEWKEPYTSITVRVDGKYDFEIFGNGMILQLKQCGINYVLNGGTLSEDAPKFFRKGETISLRRASKSGTEFAGWYNNAECTGNEITKIIDAPDTDITLYAKWADETNQAYFIWSEDSKTLLGFSTLGLEKYNNNEITDLIIPKKHNGVELVNIGESAFASKTKLKTVIIPDTVENVYQSAFGSCSGIENLQMPISANQAPDGVYYHNGFTTGGLKKLKLTPGNGTVRNYDSNSSKFTAWGFSSTNQVEITLDEGITEVGNYTFYYRNNTTFNLPSTLETVGAYAFGSCYGGLIRAEELKNLKVVKDYGFSSCTGMTGTLNLSNIETLNSHAFSGCEKIGKLILPDTLTELGNSAFYGLREMKSLQMPIGVNLFEGGIASNSAIYVCPNLEEIKLTYGTGQVYNFTETSARWTPWVSSKDNNPIITVEEGIKKIGEYTFSGCTTAKFKLPNSLEIIGKYAFNNCKGLSGALNLENIEEIGEKGFYSCPGITGTIDLTNVETVGASAFCACTGIEKLIIPDTTTTLGANSFMGCSGMKSLQMPIGLDMFNGGSVGDSALFNCTGLTEITLTPGQGTVFNYNENGAKWTPWKSSKDNNLTITLAEGIKTVGSYTFHNCTNAKFNLPSTLETVNAYAFAECKGEIKASEVSKLKVIKDRAFYNCTGLTGELIFTNLQDIGTYSFGSCSGITKVVIPDTMTVLGVNSFIGCSGITSLKLPIGINMFKNGSVGDAAFCNCSGVTDVRFTYGTGLVYNFNENGARWTPWYDSRTNHLNITLEKGIRQIGAYTFYSLNDVTFNYTGNAEDWSKVTIGANNASLTNRTVNFI